MKGKIAAAVLAGMMTAACCMTAMAGQWIQTGNVWRYLRDDGQLHAGGWQWINGRCYYFDESGNMLAGVTTPDGYTVDESGAWTVNGVVQLQQVPQASNIAQAPATSGTPETTGTSESSKLAGPSGSSGTPGDSARYSGPSSSGNSRSEGMGDGWYETGDDWKYILSGRYIVEDWRRIDGEWYYFNEDGCMVTGFQEINRKHYYFKSSGALQTSSFTLDDIRYVVGKDGNITDEIDGDERYSYGDDYGREYDRSYGRYDDDDDDDDDDYEDDEDYDDEDDEEDDIDEDEFAEAVFELINKERRAAGKPQLEWDEELVSCAEERAGELADDYGHTRPGGENWKTILEESDLYPSHYGENIAEGQRSPAEVVRDWMKSSTHKSIILDSNYTRTGVGCTYSDGVIYWEQLFTD